MRNRIKRETDFAIYPTNCDDKLANSVGIDMMESGCNGECNNLLIDIKRKTGGRL